MVTRMPAEVFSPGDFIRDELNARGWTQGDLAQIMARPPQFVNELVSGKKMITPETAMGLAKAFGDDDALYWMNLDNVYRLSPVPAHPRHGCKPVRRTNWPCNGAKTCKGQEGKER